MSNDTSSRPLEGRRIVVTGSGRGIGAAVAAGAAALGARVVVNDVDQSVADDTVAGIRSAGGEAVVCVADISTWSGASEVIGTCVESFGGIDGLVNNAGVFAMGTAPELDAATVERVFGVNAFGTAYCGSLAAKHMVAQDYGSIVNVTSGAHLGIPTMGIYGASKGAVASFTYAWASEFAGTGVRCNAISPFADTRMGKLTDEYLASHGRPPHAGTQPEPEANVGVVLYLLSDRSRALNGQIVRVEGSNLSTLTHPAVWHPVLERERWGFDDVCEAFEGELGERLAPLGVVSLVPNYVGSGSAFWTKVDAADWTSP